MNHDEIMRQRRLVAARNAKLRAAKPLTPVKSNRPKPASPARPAAVATPSKEVLWVMSFAEDMAAGSGLALLRSVRDTGTAGDILVLGENLSEGTKEAIKAACPYVDLRDVRDTPLLDDWLAANAERIPVDLGGKHHGRCECGGGPFTVHDKRHRMPCLAAWFCRNASRWFRKVVAWQAAASKAAAEGHEHIVWLDADCVFLRRTKPAIVRSWFKAQDVAAFYLRNRRPAIESGIVGFRPSAGGDRMIAAMVARYTSGTFVKDTRWDDSHQLTKVVESRIAPSVDLARRVGPGAAVVAYSLVGPFIGHDKGRSRRAGVLT